MPTKYKRKNNGYRNKPHTGKKAAPTGTDADLNMATLANLFADEDAAREFLEAKRWANGRICPHCGHTETYKLTPKKGSKSPVRPGVYKCKKGDCRKQFTVRIGTIFEESKIPICKWLMAIHLMTSSKKGVSSHQIARELGITVKSAWFVTHRIREAMKKEPMAGMLSGTVEVDETYVGARKPRYKGTSKRGRGTNKQPVMVLVEREGKSFSMPIPDVSGKTLKTAVDHIVSRSSTVMTDEWAGYNGVGFGFDGGHEHVKHRAQEYVRQTQNGAMIVSTNTAESWCALLKRAHYGIHHQWSVKHMHRYCNERTFMWDNRRVTDGQRMVAAISGAEGKRLMYRDPVGE